MVITETTQKMLASLLSRQPLDDAIRTEILALPALYLVAAPHTTPEGWQKREFAAYVDDYKNLIIFLDMDAALLFARRKGCVLDGQPLAAKTDRAALSRLIAEYTEIRYITGIIVYSRPPVYARFTPAEFIRQEDLTSVSDVMQDDLEQPQRTFVGVKEAMRVLDTFDKEERKRLDPGSRVETLPSLIQSLMQQNDLDPAELDKAIGLPEGYTRSYCNSPKNTSPGIEVVSKYLAYFGLSPYIYCFKQDSRELMQELKRSNSIDKYSLKSASISPEKYTLQGIQRGEDGRGAYVYKLSLQGKDKTMDIIVSNPVGYQVGKEYRIESRDGDSGKKMEEPSPFAKRPLIDDNAADELIKELEDKTAQKFARSKAAIEEGAEQERTYEEKRKDAVIKYFRERGEDGKAALAKYRAIEPEEDILDEFYKYIEKKQFGKLDLFGYTAKKLVKELHYEPYEAYLMMVSLRNEPKDTRQRLKYRETDPQYQSAPNPETQPQKQQKAKKKSPKAQQA